MTDSITDPKRADETDDTAPPRILGAPEMSFEDALAYVESMCWWRSVPSRSDQALRAMAREVERLKAELLKSDVRAHGYKLELDEALGEVADADGEIALDCSEQSRIADMTTVGLSKNIIALSDATIAAESRRRLGVIISLTNKVREYRVENKRLRGEVVNWRSNALRWADMALATESDVHIFQTALPDIIGCAHHKGIECRMDQYGWAPCCATRLRAVKAGLIPTGEQKQEDNNGA